MTVKEELLQLFLSDMSQPYWRFSYREKRFSRYKQALRELLAERRISLISITPKHKEYKFLG